MDVDIVQDMNSVEVPKAQNKSPIPMGFRSDDLVGNLITNFFSHSSLENVNSYTQSQWYKKKNLLLGYKLIYTIF